MARPEKELTRTHHLNLCLTNTEYEVAKENAKQAKLTLSEFIRCQLVCRKVTVKYEIVADVQKLITEFEKTESNLTQHARYLNQGDLLTA